MEERTKLITLAPSYAQLPPYPCARFAKGECPHSQQMNEVLKPFSREEARRIIQIEKQKREFIFDRLGELGESGNSQTWAKAIGE